MKWSTFGALSDITKLVMVPIFSVKCAKSPGRAKIIGATTTRSLLRVPNLSVLVVVPHIIGRELQSTSGLVLTSSAVNAMASSNTSRFDKKNKKLLDRPNQTGYITNISER